MVGLVMLEVQGETANVRSAINALLGQMYLCGGDKPAGPQLVSGAVCSLFDPPLHFSNCNILNTHRALRGAGIIGAVTSDRWINVIGTMTSEDLHFTRFIKALCFRREESVMRDGIMRAEPTLEVASVLLRAEGFQDASRRIESVCISIHLSCLNMQLGWSNAACKHKHASLCGKESVASIGCNQTYGDEKVMKPAVYSQITPTLMQMGPIGTFTTCTWWQKKRISARFCQKTDEYCVNAKYIVSFRLSLS